MIIKRQYRYKINDTFRDKRVINKIEQVADDEISKSYNQDPFLTAKEKDELFEIIANDEFFEEYIRELVRKYFL